MNDIQKRISKNALNSSDLSPSRILEVLQDGETLELKQLEKELDEIEIACKKVSHTKHERRLKNKNKEKYATQIQQTIAITRNKLDSKLKELKLKIEMLEAQIKAEEEKSESTIKYHMDIEASLYEDVEVEVDIVYPGSYYKKLEQKRNMESTIKNRQLLILKMKNAELEGIVSEQETPKEKELRLKREKIRAEIEAQERMKKEVEEQERREREETFEARALEREKQQMQEEMMAERLYKEKHQEKEEEWEDEMTDEQLLELQITNTKGEIRDIARLISDKQEEMRENPSDVEVYDEIQQLKIKLKESKEYLTSLTSKT